jgi:hypothetical protein
MDTDCELPVPMHRLFITLDQNYDSPLPFRYQLRQVTELTAENATPYSLPKERRLSRFDKLPAEPGTHLRSFGHISEGIYFVFAVSYRFEDVRQCSGHA